jgi:hypothetical protein
MRRNCVPTPARLAGDFMAAPPSCGPAHSPPKPIGDPRQSISAWPTFPSASVTRVVVSKPKAASSHLMAAMGSL